MTQGALLLSVVACGRTASYHGRQVVDRIETPGIVHIVGETSVSSDYVNATVERVWRELQYAYAELEIPLTVLDGQRRELGNARLQPRRIGGERLSQFLDCGRSVGVASYADTYLVTMYLVTRISEAESGRTLIQTELDASAEPIAVRGGPIHCTSNGSLEARIASIVSERSRSPSIDVGGIDAGGAYPIRGQVVDSVSGQPLSGVSVALVDSAGGRTTQCETDAEGYFRLAPPSPGIYRLSASHDGYRRSMFPSFDFHAADTFFFSLGLPRIGAPPAIGDAFVQPRRRGRLFENPYLHFGIAVAAIFALMVSVGESIHF